MAKAKASELVLNEDGSVYHLHLLPEQLAPTVILVGDPGRVERVSRHFDKVDHRIHKREFITHTGMLGNLPLSVISTGIGPDNIDVVVNELDQIANWDLDKRMPRQQLRPLRLIRIGTTGTVQPDLPPGTFVASAAGVGLDNLLHYYPALPASELDMLPKALFDHLQQMGFELPGLPYAAPCSEALLQSLGADFVQGITLTCPGFYAPQGRSLRGGSKLAGWWKALEKFRFRKLRITNIEMETSAIFGLSKILGHEALSFNTVLANRSTGAFTQTPVEDVDRLIQSVLEKLLFAYGK